MCKPQKAKKGARFLHVGKSSDNWWPRNGVMYMIFLKNLYIATQLNKESRANMTHPSRARLIGPVVPITMRSLTHAKSRKVGTTRPPREGGVTCQPCFLCIVRWEPQRSCCKSKSSRVRLATAELTQKRPTRWLTPSTYRFRLNHARRYGTSRPLPLRLHAVLQRPR